MYLIGYQQVLFIRNKLVSFEQIPFSVESFLVLSFSKFESLNEESDWGVWLRSLIERWWKQLNLGQNRHSNTSKQQKMVCYCKRMNNWIFKKSPSKICTSSNFFVEWQKKKDCLLIGLFWLKNEIEFFFWFINQIRQFENENRKSIRIVLFEKHLFNEI